MSQAEITIREATLEDSSAIATILHALGWFQKINDETVIETQAHVAESIIQGQHEQIHTLLVAEHVQGEAGERVVGYVLVHWFFSMIRGREGYISELFVLPSETGKGIGSRLLTTIEAYAQERKCQRLLLMNRRIRESYQRGFYTKRGWEESTDGVFFVRSLS